VRASASVEAIVTAGSIDVKVCGRAFVVDRGDVVCEPSPMDGAATPQAEPVAVFPPRLVVLDQRSSTTTAHQMRSYRSSLRWRPRSGPCTSGWRVLRRCSNVTVLSLATLWNRTDLEESTLRPEPPYQKHSPSESSECSKRSEKK
jgi:hypothetical protein